MKKAVLVFVVAGLVLVTLSVWIYQSGFNQSFTDISMYAVIIVIVAFAVFIGLRRLKSLKLNQPPEDELSKKIMQKAMSLSYLISIYLWLFMMYISDKTALHTHSLIGLGILGMAVIFAVCWIVISRIGVKDV